VLELLSRDRADPYESYITRIAEARGPAGRIARIIKLADLNEHLQHGTAGDAPDYAAAALESCHRKGDGESRRHPPGWYTNIPWWRE